MAGLKGKSGPPGNMNAFKHGLAAIQKRREESITTEHEESVRQQILDGLISDKGGLVTLILGGAGPLSIDSLRKRRRQRRSGAAA
jgi:hypothetical protein